jgi:hypothetical protein
MGSNVSTDETQPRQTGGHYIGRATLGWPGTIFTLWMIAQATMLEAIRTRVWILDDSLTPLWLCIPTLLVGTLGFVANIFYFGPESKKAGGTNPNTWLHSVSRLGPSDRYSRLAMDQWILVLGVAGTAFMMIFMIVFYDRWGIFPWLPLPDTPTNVQIDQRAVVSHFIEALIYISGAVVFASVCVLGDVLKRLHGDAPTVDSGDYKMVNVGAANGVNAHHQPTSFV